MDGDTFTRIGKPAVRIDGRAKVTGRALYASDEAVPNPAYAFLVTSAIARGRVASMGLDAARAVPGVLDILTHWNVGGEAKPPAQQSGGNTTSTLESDQVWHDGQIIGVVLADSYEAAREAAYKVEVSYHEEPPAATFDSPGATEEQREDGEHEDYAVGDAAAVFAAAPVKVDALYGTPTQHHNPIELFTTTCAWNGGQLTIWEPSQFVYGLRGNVAKQIGVDPNDVRVVSKFVGGAFGSKGGATARTAWIAIAARRLGRPVKLVATRDQGYTIVTYRAETRHHIQLGADRDGRLLAFRHEGWEVTSRPSSYNVSGTESTARLYACPNILTRVNIVHADRNTPGFMRAPPDVPYMFALESAMDELACALNIDPVELRRRNEPQRDPVTGLPFTSRHLLDCLDQGAERFGWAGRDSRPGVRREGNQLVGTGVASSVYPVYRQATSTAAVRFDGGRYIGRIGAADLGTGAWTVLPQILADALRVPEPDVDVLIGDTDHPVASVAGGSSGTATWGTALVEAAREFRRKFGADPHDGDEAEGSVGPNPETEDYAMFAFGAQFAEARVDVDTGEIRVPRLLGVFAAGRILNPRTARSQFIGGMTMGLSMTLHEHSLLDPRTGHVVNHDLAEYHVASCADVGSVEAHWIDEHDPHVNPMGAKGVGEIGIVGTAAAVSNAVHHATGVRVRDLPITLDAVLAGLPG